MGNRGSLGIREVYIGYLLCRGGRSRGDWLSDVILLQNRLDSVIVHRANGFGDFHPLRLYAVGV